MTPKPMIDTILEHVVLDAFPWVHPDLHVTRPRSRDDRQQIDEILVVLTPRAKARFRIRKRVKKADFRISVDGQCGKTAEFDVLDETDAAGFVGHIVALLRTGNPPWANEAVFPVGLVAAEHGVNPSPLSPEILIPRGTKLVWCHDLSTVRVPPLDGRPPNWIRRDPRLSIPFDAPGPFFGGAIVEAGPGLAVKDVLDLERMSPCEW